MGNKLYLTIANKIVKNIEHNGLKKGDKVPTESRMMEEFGVSRTTIREAVKYLCAEGVLTVQQGRGTFVSNSIDQASDLLGVSELKIEERLSQLMEARLLVEPQIVLCAVQKASAEDIRLMEKNIAQMKSGASDKQLMVNLDVQFHELIAKCTRNEVFIKLIPLICTTVVETEQIISNVEISNKTAVEAHTRILEAIKNRDALNARYLLERHIQETIQFVKNQ